MPKSPVKLTYECIEQLHTWVRANCPCALENVISDNYFSRLTTIRFPVATTVIKNEEFIPGLICIVEMEVETALKRQQSQQFQNLQTPSLQ